MKRKVLASLLVIAVVAGLVGASTWAYFTGEASSTDNIFTAGDLVLELKNAGGSWLPGVTGTWVSPPGWGPGDEVENTIWLKNVGSVDANVARADFINKGCGGGENLFKVIEVTSIRDSIHNFTINYAPAFVDDAWPGNWDVDPDDGKLSLWEVINGGGETWDFKFYVDDFLTGDPTHEDLLPAGGPPYTLYGLRMIFQFMPEADDTYQNASCTFDVLFMADQEDPFPLP